VPNNTKTKVAVIKVCLYEPQINRAYAEIAAHYDTPILPDRPRDKARVAAKFHQILQNFTEEMARAGVY